MMAKAEKGKAGCGCLLFLLVVCMVVAGVLIHPFSLKVLAGRFIYADKIVPCDAVFVPRFEEDKTGEVYVEAFREFWAGNGKAIWIENGHVLGLTMKDIVARMAKARGIKEDVIKAVDLEGDDRLKAEEVKATLAKQGIRRVVLVVPQYASRRFHLLYESEGPRAGGSPLFLVKPVEVPYFKADRWWKNDLSRGVMEHELYELGLFYVNRFRPGAKEGDEKKPTDEGRSSLRDLDEGREKG
jgi:hypothetical protein